MSTQSQTANRKLEKVQNYHQTEKRVKFEPNRKVGKVIFVLIISTNTNEILFITLQPCLLIRAARAKIFSENGKCDNVKDLLISSLQDSPSIFYFDSNFYNLI